MPIPVRRSRARETAREKNTPDGGGDKNRDEHGHGAGRDDDRDRHPVRKGHEAHHQGADGKMAQPHAQEEKHVAAPKGHGGAFYGEQVERDRECHEEEKNAADDLVGVDGARVLRPAPGSSGRWHSVTTSPARTSTSPRDSFSATGSISARARLFRRTLLSWS